MTRETKIGMLVGLAFIIVIGILLSDHMTSTTEPAKAPLSSAGSEVRSGVTTPAAARVASPAAVVQIPPIAPSVPVPTQDELASRNTLPPIQKIAVGPGTSSGQPQQIIIQQSNPAQPTGGPNGPIVRTPAGFGNDQTENATELTAGGNSGTEDLDRWASRSPADPTNAGRDGGHTTPPTDAPQRASVSRREYTVESGDTLSKLAGRFLGGNTKMNRDAIVDANPSLKKDPNRLIVGKMYFIPTPPASKTVASVATPAPTAAKAPVARTPAEAFSEATTPVKPSGATAVATVDAGRGLSWYTVSEGDNLWKIAADQLGSGNEWQKIKDLNKDVLKGGDTVQPNMRLRIPQRGLASAN